MGRKWDKAHLCLDCYRRRGGPGFVPAILPACAWLHSLRWLFGQHGQEPRPGQATKPGDFEPAEVVAGALAARGVRLCRLLAPAEVAARLFSVMGGARV